MGQEPGDAGAIRAAIADLAPVIVPEATLDGDDLLVPVSGGRARASTGPLITACSKAQHHQWPTIIELWFRNLRQHLNAAPSRAPERDDLRVRLVPRTDDDPPVPGLIVMPYGPHFDLQLVAELPDRREWMTEDGARRLGLDRRDAFSQGLQNTIRFVLMGLDIRDHELAPGVQVSVAAADGVPYVSTGLTSIPNLFRSRAMPYGALVAAPRLSAVVCYPVDSDQALSVALVLSRLVGDMYRDANDPCSPSLWWWHNGQLYPLSVSDDNRVGLHPDLESVVASLPPVGD